MSGDEQWKAGLMREDIPGIERAQALVNRAPHLRREKVYSCFYVRELFGLPEKGNVKWMNLN